jgi:hypothetical protein
MIDDMAKSLPIIIKRRVKIKVPSNLDPSSPTLPSQKTLQTQNCHEQLVVNQRERERERNTCGGCRPRGLEVELRRDNVSEATGELGSPARRQRL